MKKNNAWWLILSLFLVAAIGDSCQEICDSPSGGSLIISFYDKTTGLELPEAEVRANAAASTDLAEQPQISLNDEIYVDFSDHACVKDTIALQVFWDSALVETVHFRLLDVEELCGKKFCCDNCYVVGIRDITTDSLSVLDDMTIKVKI